MLGCIDSPGRQDLNFRILEIKILSFVQSLSMMRFTPPAPFDRI